MSKTLAIDRCILCPNQGWNDHEAYCWRQNKAIDCKHETGIPAWCPLPDTQEQVWRPVETAPKDKREILLWCGWRMVGFYDGGSFWDDDGVNPVFMATAWAEHPAPPEIKS